MDEQHLRAALTRYRFYHVIALTETLRTPGWDHPDVQRLQALILRGLRTLDLAGKRVLDVGCRDGLFSFEAERLGAAEVIGIDNDLSPGATEFLIPYFHSRVRMHELNLYDLTPEHFGHFDVVLCPGVLYHLRHPFWGLKRLKEVLKPDGLLLLETAVWLDDNERAVLYCPVGADSPYEPTSCTFFNCKGLHDTLNSLGLRVQREDFLTDTHIYLERPWHKFKLRLRALLNRPHPPMIDRATFLCRATNVDPALAGERVEAYWHGTHQVHSVHGGQVVAP
jgi:2-polyprenyl-3-methyl-5-hydroxy-6-metoxy-1,4-benzoquinol methylase